MIIYNLRLWVVKILFCHVFFYYNFSCIAKKWQNISQNIVLLLSYFFRSGQKEMCLFEGKMKSSTWAWLNSFHMCIVFRFLQWERSSLRMNNNERFFKATRGYDTFGGVRTEWGQPITPPCFNSVSRRLSQMGTTWDATLAKVPFISSFLSQIVISK